MRTLRVISRLNVGGPARHVTTLDAGLAARGHETRLVYGSVGSAEADLERLIEERGLPAVKVPELGRRINPLSDFVAFVKLLRLTFRTAPDVVHTHTAKGGTLGRLAAAIYNLTVPRRRRCLVVHTFHGHVFTGYFGRFGSGLVRRAERMLAMITDHIVTISERQRQDIVERFAIAPACKVSVVPLGIDLEQYLRMDTPASSDGVAFGFAGRFVPIKDLETLIRAFATVADRVPDALLLLAGDGELRGGLEQLVASLQLADRVRFAGWFDEPADLLGFVDVAVLSSRNEGTPLWLIEAMAAGRPVVSTAVGGVPDLVEDGETGLLVPASDVPRLAEAMQRMVAEPELRASMGARARAFAASRFGAQRLISDIDGLYAAGLAAKRRVSSREVGRDEEVPVEQVR